MREDIIYHYNSLIDEDNDPVRDPKPLQEYMDKWDGKAFLEDLNLDQHKTVLEIGVGTGRLALKTCGQCKLFVGIDLSEKTIKRAEENLDQFHNKLLVCGDFMEYDFSERFDVIYSSLTFMHMKDKKGAIARVGKLLNSNGRFILSIEKTQKNFIEYGNRVIQTYPDSPEVIIQCIQDANMKVLKKYERDFAIILVASK